MGPVGEGLKSSPSNPFSVRGVFGSCGEMVLVIFIHTCQDVRVSG